MSEHLPKHLCWIFWLIQSLLLRKLPSKYSFPDSKDYITVRRTGSLNGKSLDFEIGRMLTPYGSIYSEGWKFKWTVDVSDFAIVLRDSVEKTRFIHKEAPGSLTGHCGVPVICRSRT